MDNKLTHEEAIQRLRKQGYAVDCMRRATLLELIAEEQNFYNKKYNKTNNESIKIQR